VLADAKPRERRAGETRLGGEREQQVLGTEVAVTKPARLLERPRDLRHGPRR
jgi:hypothetical protein